MLVAFLVCAVLATPGYSHMAETISQLGAQGRPHPEVMNTGFIICGLLTSSFGYGLYRVLGRGTGAKAVWLLLGISGVGIILSGIFQTDPKALDTPATLEGTLHSVFATLAFLPLTIAMVVFSKVVYRDLAWRGLARMSVAIAVLNLVLSLMLMLGAFPQIEGALQRAFLITSLIWMEAISLRSSRQFSAAGGKSRTLVESSP